MLISKSLIVGLTYNDKLSTCDKGEGYFVLGLGFGGSDALCRFNGPSWDNTIVSYKIHISKNMTLWWDYLNEIQCEKLIPSLLH